MTNLILTYFKRIKKDLGLKEWSIDLFFAYNINNTVHFKSNKKEAIIITNKELKNNFLELQKWFKHACLHIKYPEKTEEEINKILNN